MTKLEELEMCELYGERLGDMTKYDLMLHLMKAYDQLAAQRKQHTAKIIETLSN